MKRYRVIWFDDEYKTLNIIREKAFVNGIDLIGFDNSKEGIDELEKHIEKYDAAISDGLFYKNPGQSGDSVTDKALFEVGLALDRLCERKKLPWFILSGQDKFTKEKNSYADAFKDNKVYDKLNEDDLVGLWGIIKIDADKQPETQIRHEYSKVFEVCTDKYIGEDASKPLMRILGSFKDSMLLFDDELYFTQIRIILENIFRAANRFGLLHDKCLEGGKVNLTESSLFLSGENTKHLDVSCEKSHFTKIVSDLVKSILFITGAASHTVDADIKKNINLIEYRKTISTPYLLYSLTFQLIDIMIWFKSYADDNQDIALNKSYWLPKTVIGMLTEGKVINYKAEKGFAFFQPDGSGENTFIPPHLVANHSLQDEMPIRVEIEEYEDNRSGETKKRVKRVEVK